MGNGRQQAAYYKAGLSIRSSGFWSRMLDLGEVSTGKSRGQPVCPPRSEPFARMLQRTRG